MEESIIKFPEQFKFEPTLMNTEKISSSKFNRFVLCGMGGSHLAADILQMHNPEINLKIYSDYGLPKSHDVGDVTSTLFIACSYSGNTEETLDFLDEAYSKNYSVVVISTGGKILDFARENNLSFIEIPDTGIQPRLAVGYFTLAISSIVAPQIVPELKKMLTVLRPKDMQQEGQDLASTLTAQIPIIYTSTRNSAIAYNWKIKLNETAKVPAFCNSFPELNHNEMQAYDFVQANQNLSDEFHFIIIHDSQDDLRIEKRMTVIEDLLEEKGLPVTRLYLSGDSRFERIFKSLILADWVSLTIARYYEVDPEKVPFIEEFKKRISQ